MSDALSRPWLRSTTRPGSEAGSGAQSRLTTPAPDLADEDEGVGSYDRVLLVLVLGAMAVGIVMVYSASLVRAGEVLGNSEHYLFRSLINTAAGLVVLLVGMYIPVSWYRRHAYQILGLAILMLVGVFLFGHEAKGATRWFDLKLFRFQPTEFAKLALTIYVAFSLVKKADKIRKFTIGFAPHLVVALLLVGLCLLQPDFGSSVLMMMIVFAMVIVGGTKFRYIIGVGIVSLPVVYLALREPYRWLRIMVFMSPWDYCHSFGYHLCESLIGIGSGGVTGRGLGEGRMKLFFLPEAHTDFVLTNIIEELGYVGLVGLILLFALIGWRGLRASYRSPSLFGRFLAFGITFQLMLQSATNMGVVTGVLPTKGLTLPFISYGGSSLMVTCLMAGILLQISMRRPDDDDDEWRQQRVPYDAGRWTKIWWRIRRTVG